MDNAGREVLGGLHGHPAQPLETPLLDTDDKLLDRLILRVRLERQCRRGSRFRGDDHGPALALQDKTERRQGFQLQPYATWAQRHERLLQRYTRG
jgi:hypothetical protein